MSRDPSRSTRTVRARASFLVLCERGLWLLGSVCLLSYAVACTQTALFQAREEAAFDEALRASIHAEQHDTSSWSKARVEHYQQVATVPVTALARLEVPDASVSVMVLPGTDEVTLNRAVGHIEGTPLPGAPGNVGIAGHRDGFFRGLRNVEAGDRLTMTTLDGVAHYEVESIDIVDPQAVEVLDPTPYDALTLVTCYPFYYVGDAPQRYIVRARKVDFETHARLRD
jgi:sortase A